MLLCLRLLTDTLRRSGTRRRDLLWENLALRQLCDDDLPVGHEN